MSSWDRIQRTELELLQKNAIIGDLQLRLAVALQQRDTARRIVVDLENENAALRDGVVMVPVLGDAT